MWLGESVQALPFFFWMLPCHINKHRNIWTTCVTPWTPILLFLNKYTQVQKKFVTHIRVKVSQNILGIALALLCRDSVDKKRPHFYATVYMGSNDTGICHVILGSILALWNQRPGLTPLHKHHFGPVTTFPASLKVSYSVFGNREWRVEVFIPALNRLCKQGSCYFLTDAL